MLENAFIYEQTGHPVLETDSLLNFNLHLPALL